MTMSSKKDGLVNIGGFIALNDENVFNIASNFTIIYEGFITYGGMAGRDMAALAVGLNEATEFEYLESRISQVEYLGNKLIEFGIPIQKPIGGHAVFVDSLKFLPNIRREEYPAQTLANEIYKEAGIRTVETVSYTHLDVYKRQKYFRLQISFADASRKSGGKCIVFRFGKRRRRDSRKLPFRHHKRTYRIPKSSCDRLYLSLIHI